MKSEKRFKKQVKKLNDMFYLLAEDCCKNVGYKQFLDISCDEEYVDEVNGCGYVLCTVDNNNFILRERILCTLRDIKYTKPASKKNKSNWTPSTIIAFLHCALKLYVLQNKANCNTDLKQMISAYESEESIIKEIEEIFSVKQNRIISQVNLFLFNHDKGAYGLELELYFTDFELLYLKYRNNIEKIQQDIEDDKIPEDKLEMVQLMLLDIEDEQV